MRLDLAMLTAAIQFFLMVILGIGGWVSIKGQLARLTAQVEILLRAQERRDSGGWADGPRRRMDDLSD